MSETHDERGKFKKGHGGLRKGKLNKATAKNREVISFILSGQQDQAVDALNKLYETGQYSDYLRHYIAMLEFVTPKMQRIEWNPETDKQPIIFNVNELSNTQILQILNESETGPTKGN